MSYLDLNLIIPELLLMRVDKMSMAASLEARAPFLDHKFVELAMSIPQSIKAKNNDLKYILKKAVRGIIPDELINRKKQGFGVPLYEWFLAELGDFAEKKLKDFSKNTAYFDNNLPDPICQGSILTIGKKNGMNIIAFCNAVDTKRRDNLTVRISFNEGRTWKKNILVDKSPDGKTEFTAYSDLVNLSQNSIGVLYERANYSQISFTKINWK